MPCGNRGVGSSITNHASFPSAHEKCWSDFLTSLRDFVSEHGHADVPRNYTSPCNVKLGRPRRRSCLCRQRTRDSLRRDDPSPREPHNSKRVASNWAGDGCRSSPIVKLGRAARRRHEGGTSPATANWPGAKAETRAAHRRKAEGPPISPRSRGMRNGNCKLG